MIKKLIKYGFNKMGYRIKKNRPIEEFTMAGALQRCMKRGLQVNSVIDVGASDGRWSKNCMSFIPNAKYLLIEAQGEHKKGLDNFKKSYGNIEYVIAAAGSREGKIYFDNAALFGGLASETPFEQNCIEVTVTTIDKEIRDRKLEPPYLIKLDTHGFEIPIIEGALEAIKKTELMIIETYNYKLTNDSLRYSEMCTYMEKLGFRPIEMVDFMLRRRDASFWQMDTFFIRSGRQEFESNSFT